jgi:hypothetical protein
MGWSKEAGIDLSKYSDVEAIFDGTVCDIVLCCVAHYHTMLHSALLCIYECGAYGTVPHWIALCCVWSAACMVLCRSVLH